MNGPDTSSPTLVTIVVPTCNEEGDIAACIEAIDRQDWPLDRLEMLIADGVSTDRTTAVATQALARSGIPRFRVTTNRERSTPSNLNQALAEASGDYLVRVDARSIIPPDYVRRCVETLAARQDVVVVGGRQRAIAPGGRSAAIGIARSLNHRWTTGLSRYRRGAASGPSDTVYLGAFRTAEVRAAGGWDERLRTNQDFELNRRLARNGLVWFDARLTVGYVPRSNLIALFNQYRRFGRWKAYYWRHLRAMPRPRQLAALLVAPVTIGGSLLAVRSSRAARVVLPPLVLVGVGTIEGLGATGPNGGARARVVAMAATTCVIGGWTVGAWQGLLSGGSQPP